MVTFVSRVGYSISVHRGVAQCEVGDHTICNYLILWSGSSLRELQLSSNAQPTFLPSHHVWPVPVATSAHLFCSLMSRKSLASPLFRPHMMRNPYRRFRWESWTSWTKSATTVNVYSQQYHISWKVLRTTWPQCTLVPHCCRLENDCVITYMPLRDATSLNTWNSTLRL